MLCEADRARQVQYAPAAAATRGVAARDVIAIVFGFDDTLVPYSTSQLLEGLGVAVDSFWRETVATLVRDGCDPALAYLHDCLPLREDGVPSGSLTRQRLIEAGEGAARRNKGPSEGPMSRLAEERTIALSCP